MRALRLLILALFATSASAQVIATNTNWSGTVNLDRDVRVNPGVTLTIAAGTTITVTTTDAGNLGTVAGRVEIIAQGSIVVNGTVGAPVLFTSSGTTAGAWTGLRAEASGSITATYTIVEEATAGLESAGTASFSDGSFKTCTDGVRATGGTFNLTRTLVENANTAVNATAGTLTVDHATLVGNYYGVYASGTSGSINVTNSVISGNTYGLYRSGSVLISNSYNDVWGNSSNNYASTTAGTGSVSGNPLFVGSGATPYRLTSNSPARKSDSAALDMGAFPYVSDATPGLYGTLWTNTVVSSSQLVAGDLTVAPGVTLTLSPGVTLTTNTSDLMQSGANTGRVELIVRGTLSVNASGNNVVLTSSGASAGSWTGVRVEAAGTLNASGLTVERATAGLDSLGASTVSASIFRDSSSGVRASGGTLSVSSSLFLNDNTGAEHAAGTLSLDHDTFISNYYGVYEGGTTGSVNVTNSILTGNTYGLYRSGSVLINNSYNDVWGNSSNNYASTTAGTGSFSSNPLFVGSGATPYRLTSNSPARYSDSTGGDLGAFPYVSDATAGLHGTLWSNTTLTSGTVLGDLVIPAGVTVVLPAGVTLTANTSDDMQSGTNSGRVELIVRGTLQVTGTPSMPAVLTSSGASAGAWTGVRVEASGTLTASGLVVNRATAGVEGVGSVTISDCVMQSNSDGVLVSGGTTSLTRCLFLDDNSGVEAAAGTVTVDHSTFVTNYYGVYAGGTSGSINVTNSVLSGNTYGLYRSGSVLINNSYNDVWGNSSNNYASTTAGTGSISSNPLFVGSGATPYRLTSNSPARKSDSTGGDLGAFPYVSDATNGLHGTLWVNTTVSSSQIVAGDLTVAPGVTLTLSPGVTLTTNTSDLMQSGANTGRVELIVRGTLSVNASGNNVVLTSSGASAGSWTGVRVEATGTLSATGLTVERATAGLDSYGASTVFGSIFRDSSSGVRASGGTLSVSTSLFFNDNSGAEHAAGTLSLDHDTFVSNYYGVYAGGTTGSINVTNSILTGNTYGLYRSGSVLINNSYNDVWGNSSNNYASTTAGGGSFSSNPLFVGSGATPYRLTSNSPARYSDSTGGDLGAFPYVADPTTGLHGTLWSDTTLSTSQIVTGDLTVPAGVTVTLAPGVVLTANTSDDMQSGTSTSRVELIVRGTLTASAVGNNVVLTSSGASASSWTGVRVEATGNASLSGITISRANAGIEAYGNVNLTDCVLQTNSDGVRTQSGSTTIARCLMLDNNAGLDAIGGSAALDHSTLSNNYYGVYANGTTGSVNVTNSVITGNTYGLYRSGSVLISNSYDDVWGNSSNNYASTTAGAGNISSNPLFVGTGATPYRLTSNSPARKSDSAAADMGAFPYVADPTNGLHGTLWSNTTVSTSQPIAGDLTLAPGVTVTLAPGVTLTTNTSDLMQAGSSTARVEIIVQGTLQSSGTLTNPVVLTSTGASAGSWTGVRVLPTGTLTLTGTTITRASNCLDLAGAATVSASRFTNCTTGISSSGGVHNVSFSVFDANNTGVYGGQGGSDTLDHLTLYSNSYGVYSASSTGSLGITNSILSGNTYGLYRSGSVPITNSYNLLFNSPLSSVTLGSNSTTAVDPLLVSPATGDFHLQATSPARGAGTGASDQGAFPFAPGAVDRVVVAPPSATVAAGGTFTFSATAYDAANNPVPSAVITWSASAAAGVISSGGVLTASCTPGTVTAGVTATANGKSGTANVTITAAPIASLVVTPANPTVKSQQTRQFSVTALDVCNNPVASPAITWSVTGSAGIIDSTGLYTAGCSRGAFPMSIVASAGSVTGRASVTVDPGVLANVSLSPTSATVAANGTRQFTGSASDGCGNPLTSTITYATSIAGANINTSGLFTAGTTPGTFATGVTASASEGAVNRSASASVTITGGSIASVTVMPATATLATGASTNFMAVAVDGFGNMVAGTPTWSVVAGGGTINASTGTFTAGSTAGTFPNTVQATIGGVSGFATVIVQPGAVTRVTVAPMNVTLAPGGTTTFTAQAFDTNNNVVITPLTWAASSAAGTITQGGAFTAGTMSGNYPASVTASVGSVSGSASVTINAGALAQLSVTPAVATTQAGGTLAFTASGRDGNGNTVAVTPVWSVVAGGGTISPAGVFSAGTTTGTFNNTVRAESNGVTSFATVTVTAGPLVQIEITPSSVDLLVGGMQQFSGVGKDAFGNVLPTTLTWSTNPNAGSITAGGAFTAGVLAGDFADGVRASSGTVNATASVRVRDAMVMDAGTDAGVDAGVADAGLPDAGSMVETDAGVVERPDAGDGMVTPSGCGCSQTDALMPLLGLVMLALRRRNTLSPRAGRGPG